MLCNEIKSVLWNFGKSLWLCIDLVPLVPVVKAANQYELSAADMTEYLKILCKAITLQRHKDIDYTNSQSLYHTAPGI